ncbi:SIALI-17 repeat-containing surface protein [Streptococcus mitis]|uniref:SIALI-17 repeat-containing surface protein n=1 Tax=Streptococcus mitis TaxID=28037 RepID=UPI0021B83C67|nr:SIALI-17 repeat-containing surface protein [Streptococcus mitis]MDK6635993.1 Ig-like domain-containing protein [Streptococcus mitis]MDK7132613.1 Ig-like domain-containing protein [Streptococcus mitis]
MKKEHKEIFSIRKYKAYGANSALIGLVGPAVLMGVLMSPVQAEESASIPDLKPLDRAESSESSTRDIETNHLIVTSSHPEENATETAASGVETGIRASEELTTPKRAVSIVYKVRYVDRKSHQVVHEVTKTKTVETTEAKAKVIVTEIGGELANDSQLESYYVPDGNPTTFTKEIVEGEDNVFVYEVEGFGKSEATDRTVTLKYTVEYVDEKTGLVLDSEDKEETVSTFEAVVKKEVTVQASIDGNESLKGWSISDNATSHQTITLSEGVPVKVIFKLHNSDKGKVRQKRKVEYPSPAVTGQPYLTLEKITPGKLGEESITLAGNAQHTYEIKYKVGFSNIDASDLEMTQGAKDLGFNLDLEGGWLTATLTPTREMGGKYEVGFQSRSHPEVKVAGFINITTTTHFGFMVLATSGRDNPLSYFPNNRDDRTEFTYDGSITDPSRTSPVIYKGVSNLNDLYKDSSGPKIDITIDGIRMPTTPFGYFMDSSNQTVENATADTKRYYAMIPIFALMDRSTDYANNNKQGLSITDFRLLSASDGVEVKLVDLRKDKAPDKGVYSNTVDFQTMPGYDLSSGLLKDDMRGILDKTPYYLQFTKLPKTAGNYSVKFQMTDSLNLVKTITLNFTTYENSISSERSDSNASDNRTYALTNADALFEPNEDYVDKSTDKVTLPISDEEQILGKVTLNKDNAYIKADSFPAGVELRAVPGKVTEGHPTEAYVVKKSGIKVAKGKYSFSVNAYDGHYQTGAPRTFEFEIVDAINPIPNQHWHEGTVPTPIPVSMENNSKITGIRVESSGGYAFFEGNPNDSTISIYGLKHTSSQQKARVYVTFTDDEGKKHETFTDFYYVIESNTVDDLAVNVTNTDQTISEGEDWKEMVITTTPSEGVTIKVDKTKLPKGTRFVDNKIIGKGLYEGQYEVPVLAVKGDVVKSTVVRLTVKPKEFVVPPENTEVSVLSKVSALGLQEVPDDAVVTYRANDSYNFSNSGLKISNDGTKITGIPTAVGRYELTATISRRGSNGLVRTTTTTYTINVTGLSPSLTIGSGTQATDAYTSNETRLLASIGTEIPPITIKHDSHSKLTVDSNSLPAGLSYSYDESTHTGTITGIPSAMSYEGYVYQILVQTEMPYNYADINVRRTIWKTIYIEVTPITSALSINNENQTFAADKEMIPITVSDFDERATIDLENAPSGVRYDASNHQIIGNPTEGVGTYEFNIRAVMPQALGGQVTRRQVTLRVEPLTPILEADRSSVEVTAKDSIPTITVTKEPHSTLQLNVLVKERDYSYFGSLSDIGLSYDASTGKITGIPTVVGKHIIYLSTFLDKNFTGVAGGVRNELTIPLTVTAKEFNFMDNQERHTTVMSAIAPVAVSVPDGIEVSVESGTLPQGIIYNSDKKVIEGTPTQAGTFTITMVANPSGIRGNERKATVTIQVDPLPATIRIPHNHQTIQVGTPMEPSTIELNDHAKIYGSDALLDSFGSSGYINHASERGMEESYIDAFLKMFYGLTYDASTHTISGTPTRTGTITFTFIARNDDLLGSGEARETFVLNVVEVISKIPIITDAKEGSNVIKGSGVAGATVTVTLPDGVEKTALVVEDGTWMVDTPAPLVKGQSISARQKEVNKTISNDISATVVPQSGLVVSKEAMVDAIIEGVTTITGTGITDSTISVTLPDSTVKTATVSEGTWSVTLDKAVVKGDNIFVTQTEPNKATSPLVTATVVPKITKGDKGETGANGADGKSPVVTMTDNGDGTYSITVRNGDGSESTTKVKDGKDGKTATITTTDNPDGSHTITVTNPDGTTKETVVKNGKDGKTPKVEVTDNNDGTHTFKVTDEDGNVTNAIIKDGKDGKTANITTTENPDGSHTITVTNPDGTTKETVVKNGKDGKTPKVEVTDNNDGTHTVKVTDGDGNVTNAIIKDGKAATATTTENPDGSHTVTITNPDGTKNEFVVKNGRDGVDGRTPTASVRDNGDGSHTIVITNPEGVTTETTVRDGKSPKVTITDEQNGTHKISVLNGDGTITETIIKDGKSPVATVTDNHDGTYTIRIENGNGTVSETTVRDGKSPTAKVVDNGDGTHTITVVNSDGTTTTTTVRDGKAPKLEVIDNNNGSHTIKVTGTDGKETTTTIFDGKSPKANIVDNGDGTHTLTIVDSDGREYKSIIKDGKDGVSPTVTVKNNNDGTHVVTIINPDGSKTEMVIKDGKDGKSPKVSVEDNGDGSHTITIINSDGTVTKIVVKDGKDGRDGRDGKDGKDGKDDKCGCQDKPVTPSNDKPVPPTPNVPEGPTFAMPEPPVHELPEFNGGVPGMPEVHELPEFNGGVPGMPENHELPEFNGGVPGMPEVQEVPKLDIPTVPAQPTPNVPVQPTPVVPTPEVPVKPEPPVVPTPGQPATPVNANPVVATPVKENHGEKLPETGSQSDYISVLLGSGILLSLYVGRRKED